MSRTPFFQHQAGYLKRKFRLKNFLGSLSLVRPPLTSKIIFSLILFFLSLECAFGDELIADIPDLLQPPSPIERMVGESFSYDISFLWFDRLAQGNLSFSRGERPGTYRAVLEARTLGVAAWLTKDRVQRYVSEMEKGPDGKLRSLSHESRILKGKGDELRDRTNLYTFDYRDRQIRFQRAKSGKFYKDVRLPMAEGNPPNDFLTALYNFRAGFFGPVQEGRRYVIPTFDRDGTEKIVLEVLSPRERSHDRFFPHGGVLCRVTLGEEVFGTGGGVAYVWFDDYGRPARGIVENVIGLGDVKGTLR